MSEGPFTALGALAACVAALFSILNWLGRRSPKVRLITERTAAGIITLRVCYLRDASHDKIDVRIDALAPKNLKVCPLRDLSNYDRDAYGGGGARRTASEVWATATQTVTLPITQGSHWSAISATNEGTLSPDRYRSAIVGLVGPDTLPKASIRITVRAVATGKILYKQRHQVAA